MYDTYTYNMYNCDIKFNKLARLLAHWHTKLQNWFDIFAHLVETWVCLIVRLHVY